MAETLVSSGAMTHRLRKLEARGFVTRSSDPDDGRGVVVRLMPSGRDAVDLAFSTLIAAEHSLITTLAPAEQASVARALRSLSLNVENR
jgi:DNA-binding MarR family transcriptional regulator